MANDETEDEKPFAVVKHGGPESPDGEGWYYWDEDYADEGSVGAFATREEAVKHARDEGGYQVREP